MKWDDLQAYWHLLAGLNKGIADQFKTLMEEKHIYQKVTLDYEPVLTSAREGLNHAYDPEFNARIKKLPARFALVSKMPPLGELVSGKLSALVLAPVNVKLFCDKCERREAFIPLWYKDVTDELRQNSESIKIPPELQFFSFIFQCQSCKGIPELQAFLVRHENWQMSIHGRSPIEQVELPAHLPKAERHWYRDAVIAFQTGKILAALFYLRTFIEQFARRQTGLTGKVTGDVIMSTYAEKLPEAHRSSMPSLREWYDRLSEAIHDAKEDAELFEKAEAEIDHHFDIRRVFKIADGAPEVQEKKEAATKS